MTYITMIAKSRVIVKDDNVFFPLIGKVGGIKSVLSSVVPL